MTPIRASPLKPDPFQKAGSGSSRSKLNPGPRQADEGDRTAVGPLQFKADVPRSFEGLHGAHPENLTADPDAVSMPDGFELLVPAVSIHG
ncbi:hypothetical protein ABIE35_003901 [Paenarthrobacter sp. 4246]